MPQAPPIISSLFEFYDLIEVNPYQNTEKICDIDRFKVKCRREEGTFALWDEFVGNIPSEEDYPCLLSKERYIFDVDPLSFGIEKQQRNLYYKIEKKDFSESLCIY